MARKAKSFGWTDETKLVASCLALNLTDCVFAWNSLFNLIYWSKTTQSKCINLFFLCVNVKMFRLQMSVWLCRRHAFSRAISDQNNSLYKYITEYFSSILQALLLPNMQKRLRRLPNSSQRWTSNANTCTGFAGNVWRLWSCQLFTTFSSPELVGRIFTRSSRSLQKISRNENIVGWIQLLERVLLFGGLWLRISQR